MKTADLDFFIYDGSNNERGKVIVSLGGTFGAHTTRLVMDAASATIFADELQRVINKLPRDRVGTPADLGCAVL